MSPSSQTAGRRFPDPWRERRLIFETYELDTADQELSSALKQFAEQSGLEVVYFAHLANGKRGKGVHGAYSSDAALAELLDVFDRR